MNVDTKPRIIDYHFIISLALLLLSISCEQSEGASSSYPQKTEIDSLSLWILDGRDNSKSTELRKSNLKKAYRSTMAETSDSIKLKYLSQIQWSFLSLKDSIWFRKTNKETKHLAQQLGDSLRLAGSHWDLGIFFADNIVKDSAFYHLSKAQKLYGLMGDMKRAGILFYDMACIQEEIKDYTGSEINLIRAIELLKPLDEYQWLFDCYNVLGTVSKDLKDYKKSLQYYQIADEYFKKTREKERRKNSLVNNIGVVYLEMGDFEKAITYFERALSYDSLRLKSPRKYARTLNNLAQSQYRFKDHEGVEEMFLESIRIRDSIEDISALAGGYFSLAEYYTHKEDTLKAIAAAKKSEAFAEKSSNNLRLLESLGLLTKIDVQNASLYGQRYINLIDSLQQEERSIRNKFARIRFETEEVVAQNQLLSRQRQLWAGIAGTLFLLIGATIIIYYQRAKNQKLKFQQAQQSSNEEIFNLMLAQSEKVEEGKKLEQKRVSEELHDGVLGKLLGVRMILTGLNKRTDSQAIAERAKAIAILQNVEGEVRSVSHEMSHAAYQKIHNFILSIKDLIQTVKGAANINIDFKFPDELDWDALNSTIKINLYRIVQESLQNVVKHATCNNIYINFAADEGMLTVTIEDDGKGFVVKKGKKGIGMRNIASRVKKLNGSWTIESQLGKGTKVTISIPLVSNTIGHAAKISRPNLQEV